PRRVILKRVPASALGALKNLFRSSAVRRSWLLGHGLRERWLPTPRPLAGFHPYSARVLPAVGYFLTQTVTNAVALSTALPAPPAPFARGRRSSRAWCARCTTAGCRTAI